MPSPNDPIERPQDTGTSQDCHEEPPRSFAALPDPVWAAPSDNAPQLNGLERPPLPAASTSRSHDSGWPAIDHLPLTACISSPFRHLDQVPQNLLEGWAEAVADVCEYVDVAATEDEKTRALKWFLLLHDLLLRVPPRGGRRGHAAVAHRFAAWSEGNYAQLVRWWEADREAVRQPVEKVQEAQRSLEKALEYMSAGQIDAPCDYW